MASSNDRGLSYESVKAACERLKANGYQPENISLRDIRGETEEKGSLTTIRKHRDRWLRELRGAVFVPVQIDDEELEGLRSAIAELFSKKTTALRAEIESSATTNRSVIERLELDLEEALKCNEQLQKECTNAVSHALKLQHEVAAANLRADELAAANAILRGPPRYRLDDRPLPAIPPEIKSDDIGGHSDSSGGGDAK